MVKRQLTTKCVVVDAQQFWPKREGKCPGNGRWEGEEREGFIAAECRECRPRHWQNVLEGNHEQNLTSGGALGAPITESQRKAPILNGLTVSTGRAAAPVVTGLCGISSGSGSREPSERVAEERVARLDGGRSVP